MLFVVGEVDLEAESAFEQGLHGAVMLTDVGLVLDLTRLAYCSPRGAEVCTSFVRSATERGLGVAVVGLSCRHTQMWLLTGTPVPVQYPTTADAVNALLPPATRADARSRGEASSLQELQEQVHHIRMAMLNQATIERAKGRLMERLQCSAEEAFAILSRLSQQSNCKLYLIAEDVLASTPDDVSGADGARDLSRRATRAQQSSSGGTR